MQIFKFSSGPLSTNALLIVCPKTKKAVVIDPSWGSTSAILKKVKEMGAYVEKIILTHSHWDHFADAFELKEKTNARLYVHSLDAKNVEKPGSDGLPMIVPIHPVKVDSFLHEGEQISIGHLHAQVIHTPGHSPGAICLYFRSEKVLISGDTLFKGSFGNLSLPTAEPEKMWESLKKLQTLPADTRVIPGHGDDTSIGRETWLASAQELFLE